MRAISIPIRANEAEAESLESVFREQYPSLVRYAARVLGNLPEAEEVASDAFLKLMRESGGIRNQRGWLKQITLHLALDKLRSNQRRGRRERSVECGTSGDPERDLSAAEEQARVRRVLAALPDQDAGLLLGRAEGSSYQELAEGLGLRVTSIGTMLARAERRFRTQYEVLYGRQ